MVDPTTAAALVLAAALLVAGVVGSLTPSVPGGLLSAAGVGAYAYAVPVEPWLLAGLLGTALLAAVVDWTAGVLSAKFGGADTTTALLAGVAGVVGFLAAGFLGTLLAVAGTVLVVEFRRTGDARASGRAAAVTTLGLLASNVVQAVVAGVVLLGVASHYLLA
jgi:uncharacterized protein YqgC (DUF456 family)